MASFTEVKETDDKRFFLAGERPRKKKKLTAGRFAKVLGANPWGTPFQAWCEVLRCKVPPFEDNKYTLAGKAIESKLIEFAKESVSPYIQSPEEYFECEDAKRFMNFEFFEEELFGGMWDALAFAKPGITCESPEQPIAVVECKTTSRPQDWMNGIPAHYAAQGLLYAKLLGVDTVYFPVAFLEPGDYDDPESFECTDDNIRVYSLDIGDPFGDWESIDEAMDYAKRWWEAYIGGEFSPEYDEKYDAEYLSCLREVELRDIVLPDDFEGLLKSLHGIDVEIEAIRAANGLGELEKQRKQLNTKIQALVKEQLLGIEGKDALDTEFYTFKTSPTRKVDYEKLEEDGLLEKYVTITQTIRTNKK